MKLTTINIDGVRYVRARAIESEVKAIERAATQVLYGDISSPEPARLLYHATRRLTEAVTQSHAERDTDT